MRLILYGFCLIFTAAAAHADNCDTTMAQQEMNRCADLALQAADAELNDAYQDAVAYARDLDSPGAGGVEDRLRKAQRAWVAYRDAACDADAFLFDGGTMMPLIYSTCLSRLTELRRADLISFASQY